MPGAGELLGARTRGDLLQASRLRHALTELAPQRLPARSAASARLVGRGHASRPRVLPRDSGLHRLGTPCYARSRQPPRRRAHLFTTAPRARRRRGALGAFALYVVYESGATTPATIDWPWRSSARSCRPPSSISNRTTTSSTCASPNWIRSASAGRVNRRKSRARLATCRRRSRARARICLLSRCRCAAATAPLGQHSEAAHRRNPGACALSRAFDAGAHGTRRRRRQRSAVLQVEGETQGREESLGWPRSRRVRNTNCATAFAIPEPGSDITIPNDLRPERLNVEVRSTARALRRFRRPSCGMWIAS